MKMRSHDCLSAFHLNYWFLLEELTWSWVLGRVDDITRDTENLLQSHHRFAITTIPRIIFHNKHKDALMTSLAHAFGTTLKTNQTLPWYDEGMRCFDQFLNWQTDLHRSWRTWERRWGNRLKTAKRNLSLKMNNFRSYDDTMRIMMLCILWCSAWCVCNEKSSPHTLA